MKQIAFILSVTLWVACQSDYKTKDLVGDKIFADYAVEGPVVDKEGNLYAVNIEKNGTIALVREGEASLFVTLPEGSTGNGLRFNSKGDLLVADYTGHNVLKIDMETRKVSVFAHDSSMNQPNDLCITQDDYLFLSDPNWAESTGNLWRVDPEGEIEKLDSNLGTTNGIEINPQHDKLYVNESIQRKVWVYELDAERNISNKKLFAEFPDHGSDGMRVDVEGNLYIARYGAGVIAKYSAQGELLREIPLKGKKPSNIAFGGSDGKTAYVTMHERGAIETFHVETAGRAFQMLQAN